MKIGELSKETGISIRTLHHYDEIGLLKPSARSESDHRNYSKPDIERLHRIITLKGIGLPLAKISSILGEPSAAVEAILERQVEMLEDEIAQKTVVVQRLKTSRELLKQKATVSVNDIIASISEISSLEENLSHDEIAMLSDRVQGPGSNGFEEKAMRLIAAIKSEIANGTPAVSAKAQELTRRWIALRDQMTGGDKDLNERARSAADNSPKLKQDLGVDEKFMMYLQQAADSLRKRD